MNYEREQRRLEALLQEELLGEDDGSPSSSDSEAGNDDASEYSAPDQIQNSESEEDLSDRESSSNDNSYYLGKDKSTRWNKEPYRQSVRTRKYNIISQLPEPKRVIAGEKESLSIWRHFFDDTIIDIIVKYTNQYIDTIRHKYTRETYARQTNLNEIQCLMGLILLAGVQKSNHLNVEELFRTDGGSVEIFRLSMSAQRFQFLLRVLRFDDGSLRQQRKAIDKICHIREIFEKFVQNCKNNYTLSAFVTVEEKMESFRGKCSFRQYIPNKPNPYGIKIQALCDSKMFYTFNMEIYPGKQPNEGPYNFDNSGLAVVQRLCEPIFNTGRNVTTDNWYTSVPLAEMLLQRGLTTVGTIRKNKKEIPPDFNVLRGRSVKSNMFGFRDNIVLVSHIPKQGKNVLLISTMHNNAKIDVETGKPDIILSYNDTKGGVDVVDRLCANYDCARATRQNLAMKLIEPHIRERQTQLNLPRSLRQRLSEILKIDEVTEMAGRSRNGRCYKKTYVIRKKQKNQVHLS
ncbi:piggyBac transposable element-derived protein 3-like [Galleria mellonella]|uniref:PiggyBac transposable element-derived protein 3-like n=1 Tax=Galleria mellonella TaxID=7137 RepID=A0ABM3MS00_GALME|nr:piggyBac transposable element-derived protein 3-like [Galleria mellonella]